jgi:heme/copper-type cytochrome/quinol oxidase subunit 1
MRFTDRLTMAQRIVVVVALGLALGAIGIYLDSFGDMGVTGWTGYAPLQLPNTGLANWLRLLIWLVLVGLWAAGAIRVLRPVPAEPAATGQPDRAG